MSDPVASNETLMQATGKGDLEAFEEIVRRHRTWAWNLAYRFLGQRDEAEDVVQEAFMRLLDTANRYQPSASFRTYFHRIVTRLCLDRAKKKQPLFMEDVPETPDPSPDAGEVMIRNEADVAVRAALDTLPPNQRMAIVFRYYDNLNYEEIAAALETSPKAVERLLARGREHLRATLGARADFS